MRQHLKKILTWVTVSIAACAANTSWALDPYAGYVMGYFTESPQGTGNDYGLHIAHSTDALHWTPLNNNKAVVYPKLGYTGLRDPFIFRKNDGSFVVMATNMTGTDFAGSNSEYIHVWDSADLRTFTNERLVRMNTSGMHTWAPEAFYDATRGKYGVFWSGNATSSYHQIFVNYTTDFIHFDAPQVFFYPGFSPLDATMHVHNGVNYLYYKRESDNKLMGTRSVSLNPRSFDNNTYTSALGNTIIEAPTVVKKNNENRWYLFGDSYAPVNGEIYAWETTDITANAWTPIDKKFYNQPLNSKHQTVVPVTQAELNNLVAKWGNPAWNRIQSFNLGDNYVRHSNFQARIDPYPTDPYVDSQWRIVPGLADAGGISFQSVSYPTYYLRHSNYNLVLNQSDNTSTFKADATFYKVPGLADGTWSSFRSYNFPTLYLRHSNLMLRIDPIYTQTDKEDATFRVGY
ncbi:MAG: glycoside hydrolase family 43 protein [Pseudomonadota bacterium]